MKYLFLSFFLVVLGLTIYGQDFSPCYIEVEQSGNQNLEYIMINEVGRKYFVTFLRPTISGRSSLSRYWIGKWDGRDLILNNGYSTYAINMLSNGNIHYYAIEGGGEFPGKDFRPITEDDLKKIAELK